MALTDMKRPKPKKSDMKGMDMPVTTEGERYPYGLRINLENDDLKKLGLSTADFKVGSYVTITAQACVTSLSSYESSEDKRGSESVGLQIEKISLDKKSAKFAGWKADKEKGPGE